MDGVGAVGGSSPVAPASNAGAVSSEGSAETIDSISTAEDTAAGTESVMSMGTGMSTSDFVSLHNNSVQQVNECQSPEMDLEKLIEMMIAIKLLQEMNKNG